jgi:hypothetical protein
VKIDTLEDADRVLAYSRTRSANWVECKPPGGLMTAVPNRGHAFVRVILHDCQRQRFSMLHVVDLAGTLACAAMPSCTRTQQPRASRRDQTPVQRCDAQGLGR